MKYFEKWFNEFVKSLTFEELSSLIKERDEGDIIDCAIAFANKQKEPKGFSFSKHTKEIKENENFLSSYDTNSDFDTSLEIFKNMDFSEILAREISIIFDKKTY